MLNCCDHFIRWCHHWNKKKQTNSWPSFSPQGLFSSCRGAFTGIAWPSSAGGVYMLKFVIPDTYMTFPLCCPKSWTHKSNTKWTLGWNSFAVSKVKNQLSVSTFQMMLVCSVSGFSKPWLLSYKWDSFYLWCSDNTVPTHTHTHAHTHTPTPSLYLA